MRMLNEQRFDPVYLSSTETFKVTFAKQEYDVVQYILPKEVSERRKFNIMRVYEADDFDGIKKVIIAVVGWKED